MPFDRNQTPRCRCYQWRSPINSQNHNSNRKRPCRGAESCRPALSAYRESSHNRCNRTAWLWEKHAHRKPCWKAEKTGKNRRSSRRWPNQPLHWRRFLRRPGSHAETEYGQRGFHSQYGNQEQSRRSCQGNQRCCEGVGCRRKGCHHSWDRRCRAIWSWDHKGCSDYRRGVSSGLRRRYSSD